MNIASLATKITYWILSFIQIQLFITLFSLPLLSAWGLPLSLLSPLGNLIFGPALTAFLLLSSLIFFTELVGIPNGLCITLLEQVTAWWLYVMHADTKTWLIGFAQPSYILLSALPVGAIFIMACKQTRSLRRSIICLSFLLISFWGYAWYLSSTQPYYTSIACNKGAVHLINHNNQLILIDPGYMGQTIGAPSWVQFTLVPQIIKQTGRTCLDHVIILQPSAMTFKAVESLMLKMPVAHLYIPYWQGTLSRAGLHAYGALTRTTMTRLGSDAQQVTQTVSIEPLDGSISTPTLSYPALAVHAFIDNQDITLYPAKYKNSADINTHTNLIKQCARRTKGTRVSDGH